MPATPLYDLIWLHWLLNVAPCKGHADENLYRVGAITILNSLGDRDDHPGKVVRARLSQQFLDRQSKTVIEPKRKDEVEQERQANRNTSDNHH